MNRNLNDLYLKTKAVIETGVSQIKACKQTGMNPSTYHAYKNGWYKKKSSRTIVRVHSQASTQAIKSNDEVVTIQNASGWMIKTNAAQAIQIMRGLA